MFVNANLDTCSCCSHEFFFVLRKWIHRGYIWTWAKNYSTEYYCNTKVGGPGFTKLLSSKIFMCTLCICSLNCSWVEQNGEEYLKSVKTCIAKVAENSNMATKDFNTANTIISFSFSFPSLFLSLFPLSLSFSLSLFLSLVYPFKVAEDLPTKGFMINQLKGIGITNQRETALLWDKRTGKPLHPAILWKDGRTAGIVKERIKATPTKNPNHYRVSHHSPKDQDAILAITWSNLQISLVMARVQKKNFCCENFILSHIPRP